MNYMNNQQGQLPFNAQGLNSQPCSFAPNQPPVAVGPMQIPNNIQYFVPFAAAAFANEVSQKANVHGGRMFLFNQITDRGYQNNEYQTGVALTLDLICLALVKGVFRTPEEAVAACAERAASILSSTNFSKYPALANYVQANINQGAQQINMELNNLVNEISAAKQRMGQGANPQQMNNQGGYRNPMQFNPGTVGSPVGHATGIFSGTGAPHTNNTRVTEPVNDRYGYLNVAAKEQPVQQNTYTQSIQQPQQAVIQTNVEDSIPDAKWIPRERQPNPPAENPGVTKVSLIQEVTSTTSGYVKIARYVTEPDEEIKMDRKAHLITPLWNLVLTDKQDPIEINGVRIDRMNIFKESAHKLARREAATATADADRKANTEPRAGIPVENHDLLVDETPFIGCNYVEEAIFNGRMHSFAVTQGREHKSVFRAKALVGIPVLTEQVYASSVNEVKEFTKTTLQYLRICGSFVSAVELLRRPVETKNQATATFIIALNKLLTYEINSVLLNKFSMKLVLNSFIEDILLVEPDIRKTYGDMFADAFNKIQETFFENCFAEQDVETVFGPPPIEMNEKIGLDYIGQLYCITYVNLLEAELDFKIIDGRGTVLIGDNPVMYQIAKDALNFDKAYKLHAAHNLVVTLDDQVFEVHNGPVSKGTYLVSNFKKP